MTDDTPRDERGLDPVPYLEAVALVLVAGLVISFGFTTPGRSWVVVVGTLAGAVGLWLLHDRAYNDHAAPIFVIVGAVASVAALLAIGFHDDLPTSLSWLVAVLACVSAAGLALTGAALRVWQESEPRGRRVQRISAVVGLGVSAAGLAVLALGRDNDWLFLTGLAAVFLGTVAWGFALVVAVGHGRAEPWAFWSSITIVLSVTAVALLAGLEVGVVWLVIPIFVALVALVPFSHAVPELLRSGGSGRRTFNVVGLLFVGAAVGALATVMLSGLAWSAWITLAIVLGLGLAAAGYVADVSALVLYFLIVVALAGVTTDRDAPLPEGSADAPRLVVFGDSYISGEGADRFVPGTNITVSDEQSTPTRNECRVAPTAYPALLAASQSWRLETYACSGAVARDVADIAVTRRTSKPSTQLEQFADHGGLEAGPISAVLVSIGGNDAWFGAIGQACLGPGSCEVHRESILRNLAVVGTRVGLVYEAVKQAVGYPATPVYAVPYPLVMTRHGCTESPLTEAEQQFLFEFSDILDDTLRAAAERAGINYLSEAVTAQFGNRICDSGPQSVNEIDIVPKAGTLFERVNPVNWVKGSAHPNELGHRNTATAIEGTLAGVRSNPLPCVAASSTEASSDGGEPDLASAAPVCRPADYQRSFVAVSRSSLGVPTDMDCGANRIPVSLRVNLVTTGSDPWLPGIRPDSRICTNLPNGQWVELDGFDASQDDISWTVEEAEATPEQDRPEFHVVTYVDASGTWSAVVLQYCDLRLDCIDNTTDLNAWLLREIQATTRSSVLPVALLFAAWWFLAVQVRVWLDRRRSGTTHGAG